MDYDEYTIKKYAKKSPAVNSIPKKNDLLKTETNPEALASGTFPKKLLEDIKSPAIEPNENLIKEIEKEHAHLLSQRPLPDLLETVDLISTPRELKSPKMGALYDQKKELNKEASDK